MPDTATENAELVVFMGMFTMRRATSPLSDMASLAEEDRDILDIHRFVASPDETYDTISRRISRYEIRHADDPRGLARIRRYREDYERFFQMTVFLGGTESLRAYRASTDTSDMSRLIEHNSKLLIAGLTSGRSDGELLNMVDERQDRTEEVEDRIARGETYTFDPHTEDSYGMTLPTEPITPISGTGVDGRQNASGTVA